jgi:hypothetical protein
LRTGVPPSFANVPLKRVEGGGNLPTVARANPRNQGLAFATNVGARLFICITDSDYWFFVIVTMFRSGASTAN